MFSLFILWRLLFPGPSSPNFSLTSVLPPHTFWTKNEEPFNWISFCSVCLFIELKYPVARRWCQRERRKERDGSAEGKGVLHVKAEWQTRRGHESALTHAQWALLLFVCVSTLLPHMHPLYLFWTCVCSICSRALILSAPAGLYMCFDTSFTSICPSGTDAKVAPFDLAAPVDVVGIIRLCFRSCEASDSHQNHSLFCSVQTRQLK